MNMKKMFAVLAIMLAMATTAFASAVGFVSVTDNPTSVSANGRRVNLSNVTKDQFVRFPANKSLSDVTAVCVPLMNNGVDPFTVVKQIPVSGFTGNASIIVDGVGIDFPKYGGNTRSITLSNTLFQTGWKWQIAVRIEGTVNPLTGDDFYWFNTASIPIGYAGGTVIVNENDNGSLQWLNTTPNPPVFPTITAQPQDLTVNPSSSAVFYVAAINADNYQWYKGTNAITGATASSYTFTAEIGDNGTTYFVRVTNSAGHVDSRVALLTVAPNPPTLPVITAQPTNMSVTEGQTASFVVVATGATSYQWYDNVGGIAGATNPNYSFTAQLGDNGKTFFVRVFNSTGQFVDSNVVTLTVTTVPAPPTITSQPTGMAVTAGQTASFIVEAINATNYQWFQGNDVIPGATNPTLSFTAQLADNGKTYFVRVANSNGYVDSNVVTLTVTAAPNNNKGIASFAVDSSTGAINLTFALNGAENSTLFVGGINGKTVTKFLLRIFDTNSKPVDSRWFTDQVIDLAGGSATFTLDAHRQDSILRFNIMGMTDDGCSWWSLISNDDGSGWNGTFNGATIQPDMSNPAGGAWQFSTGFGPNKGLVNFSLSGTSVVTAIDLDHGRPSDLFIGVPDGCTWDRVTVLKEVVFDTNGVPESNGLFVREYSVPVCGQTAIITAPVEDEIFRINLKAVINGVEYWARLDVNNSFWVGTWQGAVLIPNMSSPSGAAWQFDTGIHHNKPVITGQPQSITVSVDQAATFSVTATGAGSYQWYRNGLAITGATNPSYSLIAKESDDGAIFFVQVTNPEGDDSLLSENATLTVTSPNPHKTGPGIWLWKASVDGNTGGFVMIVDGSNKGKFKTRRHIGWASFNALAVVLEDQAGKQVGEEVVRAFAIRPLDNIFRPVGINLPLSDDVLVRVYVTRTDANGDEMEGWRTELDLRTFVNGVEGKRADLASLPVVATPPVLTMNSAIVKAGKFFTYINAGQRLELDLGLIGEAEVTATMVFRNHTSEPLQIVNGKVVIDIISANDLRGIISVVAKNDLGTDLVTICLRPIPKHWN